MVECHSKIYYSHGNVFFTCSAITNCENMVYISFRSEDCSDRGVRIVALGWISKWIWVESRSGLQIDIIPKRISNWHHSAFKIDIRIHLQIDLRIDARIAFRIVVQIECQIHNAKFRDTLMQHYDIVQPSYPRTFGDSGIQVSVIRASGSLRGMILV